MSTATIQLRAESRQIRTATDDLRALERQGSATDRTAQILTRTLGALGAALSVRQLTEYTNTWTDLNSRILNVTKDGKLAAEVMQSISDTADRTYSSLTDTAEAFLANATTLTELGYTTQQQIKLSEALNNALVVSGTKGQAAASVMDALSKSFATGELRGENFNSVIARGGRIVEALAEGLGVGTLELRKMASEGQLTTQKVFEALTSQAEKLAAEADAMAATVGDGFVRIGNAALQTVGRFDQLTGASSSVAGVLVSISESIKDIDDENLVRAAAAMDLLLKAGVAVAAVYGARLAGAAAASSVAIARNTVAAVSAKVSYDAMGVAIARTTVAMNAGAVAARGLSAALAFIGGPVGFAFLAAAGIAAYALSSDEAVQPTRDLRAEIDQLSASTKNLTKAQAELLQIRISERIEQINTSLSQMQLASGATNEELQNLFGDKFKNGVEVSAAAADELRAELKRLGEQSGELANIINGSAKPAADSLGSGTEKLNRNFEQLSQSLQRQIIELRDGRQAAEDYAIAQRLGADATDAERQAIAGLVSELRALQAAQESQSRIDSLRQGIGRDIQSGMSPLQQLEAELYQRQQIIERFRQEGALDTANADQLELDALVAFNLRKNEIEQQAAEERRRIRENEESLRRQQMMTTLGATAALFGNLADIAKEGGEKSFSTYKALASAQAAVSGVMAYMNALATPAPFPIPQILAGTIAALTAVQIAKLNSMQYSGARRQGGQVTRGNSYLVGEQGPELITMGGNARVTPFNQLMQQSRGDNNTTNSTANINFTLPETGSRDIREQLMQNRDLIYSIVQKAMNDRGRRL